MEVTDKSEIRRAYLLLIIARPTDSLEGLILAIFRRACLDCLHGDRELAADALQFLSGEQAAEYSLSLGLPASAIGDLVDRYHWLINLRFGEDLSVKGE